MGRPVVLSNGQLFVGLDENGLVHDFYYPYVGLDNLTNARSSQHKIGIWVDGRFSWTDDGSWEASVIYENDALISDVTLSSAELNVSIHLQDFVDSANNALIRRVAVRNAAEQSRDVRLFMHQVFQISRAGRADTALYVPDHEYILDYKGRVALLAAGKLTNGDTFDQFAVGNYGIEGKTGTFSDAEDGELSGNPVEHGGVDSVLRFRQQVAAGHELQVDYWVIAANNEYDARQLHLKYLRSELGELVAGVRSYWNEWLNEFHEATSQLPAEAAAAVKRSMLIIKAHADQRGSVLASGDSSIFNYGRDYYCYCWPRDAAYAMWPFIRLGKKSEPQKFFEFARDTMHPDGYLMHKYQPDRAIGSTWHPLLHDNHAELAIQEDETASVVYMMGLYYEASNDDKFLESYYDTFIVPCANFMSQYIDDSTGLPHASYDLWEQKFQTTTYTTATVIAALESAARLAQKRRQTDHASMWRQAADGIRDNLTKLYHPDGYFRKGFLLQSDGTLQYDDTLDVSSLYGPFMFAGLPSSDPRLMGTLQHVEQRLFNRSPSGGVIRFEGDGYFLAKDQYPGNPWPVCGLWLAQIYLQLGRPDEANELIQWSLDRRSDSGALGEQYDPETGFNIGILPLVWSHAELTNTLLDGIKPNETRPIIEEPEN